MAAALDAISQNKLWNNGVKSTKYTVLRNMLHCTVCTDDKKVVTLYMCEYSLIKLSTIMTAYLNLKLKLIIIFLRELSIIKINNKERNTCKQ